MLQNLWGRPPGLRGTPSSRSPPVESRPCLRRWPTRASAADEGVRPTIYADVRLWENYVALTVRERSRDPLHRLGCHCFRLLALRKCQQHGGQVVVEQRAFPRLGIARRQDVGQLAAVEAEKGRSALGR